MRRTMRIPASVLLAGALLTAPTVPSGAQSSPQIPLGGVIIPGNHDYSLPLVKDRPFILEKLTTSEGIDGKPSARPMEERLMRDSQGRERSETGFKDADSRTVFLTDPAAGFTATLFSDTRTAVVTRMRPAVSPSTPLSPSGEALPERMIAGVRAEGRLATLLIPAARSGTGADVRVITKRWFSPELQIDLMTETEDPRTGRLTSVVTDLKRSEPSPELFQIPANYTQEQR